MRKAKKLETDLVMMQVAQLSRNYRLCLNVKWYEPDLALLKDQNTNYNNIDENHRGWLGWLQLIPAVAVDGKRESTAGSILQQQ